MSFGAPHPKSMTKVAIVTGSNSGVGLECAKQLCSQGFHVVFACRSQDKAEKAMKDVEAAVSGAKMTFLQLDTGKMASVKTFAEAFLEKFDRLDYLANNAGSGYFLKEQRVTEDGLEAFFQTNYLGPFFLTKLLTPILKKSDGRMATATSIEHWDGSYNFEKATQKTGGQSYATSKLMMCIFAFEFARREGIPCVAVNPGGVFSGIWWYLRGWKAKLWNMIMPLFLLSSSQAGQTMSWLATAEKAPAGPTYLTSYKQYGWCKKMSDTLGPYAGPTVGMADPRSYSEEAGKKLWEFSEEKLKPFL
mmetsp:Transcript_99123/g.175662  ORF Transcript_99123/g.175662 Transcript_99123/m.175662 type:complete len:304 (+) Transcript_99123:61-972(+)